LYMIFVWDINYKIGAYVKKLIYYKI
jgi:hypothetical protein